MMIELLVREVLLSDHNNKVLLRQLLLQHHRLDE